MKFTFGRTRTIASRFGHVLTFEKDTPTHVPPEMYQEVLGLGGTPEDEIDLDPPKPVGPQEPTDPVEREAALFAAYEAMALRNKREEFTAGGQPHLKAIVKQLGWSIGDKERDLTWVAFQTKDKAK